MKNCDEEKQLSKKRGARARTLGGRMLGIKNMWRNMFFRKKEKTKDVEVRIPIDHVCPIQQCQKVNTFTNGEDDVMDRDKDRIRTSCKLSLQEIPEFPSKEEVKKRIEEAHKYYGIKCVYNYQVTVGSPEEKPEPLPSWYYILERPLVEQYVLMNNYIRKLSVMASMNNEPEDSEVEPFDDNEEVSSISSQSDYSDFPTNSELIGIYKKSKKRTEDDFTRNLPTTGTNLEAKKTIKSEVATIKTKDYEIVIRGPKNFFETESNDGQDSQNAGNTEWKLQREEDDGESSNDQLDTMKDLALSSGDHLPDMKDFDLSYNLSECTEIKPPLPGQSYYHWRGNSCPTKTALLSTDTRPARQNGPNSSMDFWSFRNLSLSPEFIERCNNCEDKITTKELKMNDKEYGNFSQKAMSSNNAAVKTPNQNDKTGTNKFNKLQSPMTSCNNEEEIFESSSALQTQEELASSSSTSSMTTVITKVPTEKKMNN